MLKNKPVLYLVIPCYNEEKVLPITSDLFKNKMVELIGNNLISAESRIMLVNDGSKDNTWTIIKNLSKDNELFCGVSLSRNRGHQNALLAGLMEAKNKCDITISLDCDGQDDINAVDKMIEAYNNGAEIVYGVRKDRSSDTIFKRMTAQLYYKFLNSMGSEVIYNHADYRLLSRRVLEELFNFKEVNLYLRGMIPLVGFNSTVVYYERHQRIAGDSHYPLSKMIHLGIDGITSLSVKPIRVITGFGLIIALFSFIGVILSIINKLTGKTVSGWASLVCVICFIGGVILLSLGIIGEYVGKIYLEVKHRPRYIINERTGEQKNE